MNNRKTKKVAGVDLSASSFAYVGDEQDTSSWKLPLHFPNDVPKSRNHVQNALSRFKEVKNIPDEARHDVWLVLRGASQVLGIPVGKYDFPAPLPPPPAPPPAPPVPEDVKEAIARADYLAESILKKLGLD